MHKGKWSVIRHVVLCFGAGPALTELQGRRGGVYFEAHRTQNGPRVWLTVGNTRIALRVPRVTAA